MKTDPIPWSDHIDWLRNAIAREDVLLLIGEREGEPIGVIRFELRGDTALVSVNVGPDVRGRGLGRQLVRLGTRRAVERWAAPVDAIIRPGNTASIRTFETAGYQFEDRSTINGIDCLRYRAGA